MKSKVHFISFLFGLALVITLLILHFLGISELFFSLGTIGVWLIFDYLALISGKKTSFQIFLKDKKKFALLFLCLVIAGFFIELIFRFILGLWTYPGRENLFWNIITVFHYGFIFMSFRETYNFIVSYLNKYFSFILSMIIGIIIWELPNIKTYYWVYNIPLISIEILKINILVIFGWSILIAIPLIIYKILKEK